MNGEDELTKIRAELSATRQELAEQRKSFNTFVRAQASLVMALRQAEEADQQRHRHLLNTINGLRSLALAESSDHEERALVVVTDSHGGHSGHLKQKVKQQGEVTGSFKVGGINVQLDGEGQHFKDLAIKVGKWLLVLLGMLATGGVGWLIGFVKKLGEGAGK
jgi:hypothetical protein